MALETLPTELLRDIVQCLIYLEAGKGRPVRLDNWNPVTSQVSAQALAATSKRLQTVVNAILYKTLGYNLSEGYGSGRVFMPFRHHILPEFSFWHRQQEDPKF